MTLDPYRTFNVTFSAGAQLGSARVEVMSAAGLWSDGVTENRIQLLIRSYPYAPGKAWPRSSMKSRRRGKARCKCGAKGSWALCPYQNELFGDKSLCDCCYACSQACADEV